MSHLPYWIYLGPTIVCGISSVAAVYYATKARRFLPVILAALLAGVSMTCAMPLRRTYELPWLPGIVVIFFAAMAFVIGWHLPRRPSLVATGSTRNQRQFGLGALGITIFFLCCAFSWIAFVEKDKLQRRAAIRQLESRDLKVNFGEDGYNVLTINDTSLTDADVPELISGLAVYPITFSEIDLSATEVTDEGAKAIERAVPGCRIQH